MQYNINAFILSNKQIQKKAKLFRQSVQLIERQVLSNYLRGYKGEFLIWSWGLKNKVFLSMNFMTNFGLTSNTKSCAYFNSECMLVFAACSPPFQRKSSLKAFSFRSTIASHRWATGESPFEYVDVYKYTQEIRRNVWKLRMKRWMMKVLTLLGLKFSSKKMSPAKSTYQVCCIPYSNKFASIWCEGDKDSYLTTSLFIVQF